jgi:hypothetical protein
MEEATEKPCFAARLLGRRRIKKALTAENAQYTGLFNDFERFG